MSRFNTRSSPTKTVNLAGGKAYKESTKLELVSILVSSFLKDGYYRSADDTIDRIIELFESLPDKIFAAKAAIYARRKYGMRSTSHLVAALVGKYVKDEKWTKQFFNEVVKRPDDITEILACYGSLFGKPIPNAMKKGFARAISRFSEYELAKYQGKGNEVNMLDVVNLIHPKPTPAITSLMKGTLKNVDTWESRLSDAGKSEDGDIDELKAEVWKDLLETGKLGYFALLRNLRNILEQGDRVTIYLAIEALTNREAIKKSLVLPFRFISAFNTVSGLVTAHTQRVLAALSEAMEISLENTPVFDGKTAIFLDSSGSMTSAVTRNGGVDVYTIASVFAAALVKRSECHLIAFSNGAKYLPLNPRDSLMTLVTQLKALFQGGGTDLSSAFNLMRTLDTKFDRIVILSDMQVWLDVDGYKGILDSYAKEHGRPRIFSFDLAGYGTLQIPEKDTYCLAGWSDKALDTMKFLEEDKQTFIAEIESLVL